jgi:hypothetical protein
VLIASFINEARLPTITPEAELRFPETSDCDLSCSFTTAINVHRRYRVSLNTLYDKHMRMDPAVLLCMNQASHLPVIYNRTASRLQQRAHRGTEAA